jgi:hypothetical protein
MGRKTAGVQHIRQTIWHHCGVYIIDRLHQFYEPQYRPKRKTGKGGRDTKSSGRPEKLSDQPVYRGICFYRPSGGNYSYHDCSGMPAGLITSLIHKKAIHRLWQHLYLDAEFIGFILFTGLCWPAAIPPSFFRLSGPLRY